LLGATGAVVLHTLLKLALQLKRIDRGVSGSVRSGRVPFGLLAKICVGAGLLPWVPGPPGRIRKAAR
jgi:hypothetical protein